MKIRSQPLYRFLLEANLLDASQEDIKRGKLAYRKLYKHNWKATARPTKEIRFTITIKQFDNTRKSALLIGQKPTTFAKSALLQAIGEPMLYNDQLLQVLQSVGMALIALEAGKPLNEIMNYLATAELVLKQYLQLP